MTPEQEAQEDRWAYHFALGRIETQIHVERVWQLSLKKRREVYQTWRKELGDDHARSLARFAEHLIEIGKLPKWFVKDPHAARDYFTQRRAVGSPFEPWSEKAPGINGGLFS